MTPVMPSFSGLLETCYHPPRSVWRWRLSMLYRNKSKNSKAAFPGGFPGNKDQQGEKSCCSKKKRCEWTQEDLADSQPRRPIIKGTLTTAGQATYFTHVDSVVSFFSDSIYHVFYPVGFRCEVSGLEWREIVWDCCKCFEVSWAMTWLW